MLGHICNGNKYPHDLIWSSQLHEQLSLEVRRKGPRNRTASYTWPPGAEAWPWSLTQVMGIPLGGIGQGAEVGRGPGAPPLGLCFVQVLQELRCLVQAKVAVLMVQLLLYFSWGREETVGQAWPSEDRAIAWVQPRPGSLQAVAAKARPHVRLVAFTQPIALAPPTRGWPSPLPVTVDSQDLHPLS